MKTWFSIVAAADKDEVDVNIYDYIGYFGVTAKDFIAAIQKHPGKKINVRIGSPGGSVFDGLSIANFLSGLDAHAIIDGLCASMATIVACSCKTVKMASNTFYMIHEASGGTFGTASQLKDVSELLTKINEQMAETYVARTKQSKEKVKKWMSDTTYFTAAEAKKYGFVDEISSSVKLTACIDDFNLESYGKVPEWVKETLTGEASSTSEEPPTMKELLKLLASKGAISSPELTEAAALTEISAFFSRTAQETKDLVEAKTKLETQAKQDRDQRISALVDAAIKDRKISAETREFAVKMGQQDETALVNFLAKQVARPIAAGTRPLGGDDDSKDQNDAEQRTPEQHQQEYQKLLAKSPKEAGEYYAKYSAKMFC